MTVTWISHRGLKTHGVENTRPAFQAAIEAGFHTFETDLRVTRDESIVLCHDLHFGRLSHSHSHAQRDLGTLDRSEIETMRFPDGSAPYFFDEFIHDLAGYSWVFDIKPEHGAKTLKALEIWIKNHHATDWLTSHAKFLTWDAQHEKQLLTFLPNSRIYARDRECWKSGLLGLCGLGFLAGIKKGRTYALPPQLWGQQVISPRLVTEFHRRDALVVAFLPQNISEVRRALTSGVDEILTDGLPFKETI